MRKWTLLLCPCYAVNWKAECASGSLGYREAKVKRPFSSLLTAGTVKFKTLTFPSGCALSSPICLSWMFKHVTFLSYHKENHTIIFWRDITGMSQYKGCKKYFIYCIFLFDKWNTHAVYAQWQRKRKRRNEVAWQHATREETGEKLLRILSSLHSSGGR